jgi:hypothetical protein
MLLKLRSPAFWVILSSVGLAVSANVATKNGSVSDSMSFAQEQVAAAQKAKILREGTSVPEMVGIFRIVGDRAQFVERDSSRTFRCLENLMLQRVHQVIGDEPNETAWTITGQVTEFKGENFLLIEMLRRTR